MNMSQAISKGAGTRYFKNLTSFQYDGLDEYFTVPNNANIDFERTDTFSFTMWVKPATVGAHILFHKEATSSPFSGFGILHESSGVLTFDLINQGGNRARIESTNSLTLNDWQLIAFTYDGSSSTSGQEIYINSVQEIKVIVENTLTQTIQGGNILGIGARGADGLLPYTGKLDHITVWDKELSQADIDEVWNNGRPIDITLHSSFGNVVSHWTMDDSTFGTDWTLIDAVSSNDGTSQNMELSDKVIDVPI